jgi:hypothetical protein
MIPVKYSKEYRDRRIPYIDPYGNKEDIPIKVGDYVWVAPDVYVKHLVQILCIYKSYSWRIRVSTLRGTCWDSSIEEAFAYSLPHEIDSRRLPHLGDTTRLHRLDFQIPIEIFSSNIEKFISIEQSLSKEKRKLALDGLKMEYLSLSLENQLNTAHFWKIIKI